MLIAMLTDSGIVLYKHIVIVPVYGQNVASKEHHKSGNFHVENIHVLNIHVDLFLWVYGTHENILT